MRRALGKEWAILRMAGQRTIVVARSLERAGIEAWTPIERQTRRRPRSRLTVETEAAIAPTFVFVRARHLPELAAVLAAPMSPHPPFSIFHHAGRIPLLADRDIASLRAAEAASIEAWDKAVALAEEKRRKAERHHFTVGAKVTVPDTAFAGLTGIVESGDGQQTRVRFGMGFTVAVASWLVRIDDVYAAPVLETPAASAALAS